MSEAPTVQPDYPLAEILAGKLMGIEVVPVKEASKMVRNAVKAAIEWAIELQTSRDALLKACENKIMKICGTCDSFIESEMLEFYCGGRCPFDSKGKRKSDTCEKWNIDAIKVE